MKVWLVCVAFVAFLMTLSVSAVEVELEEPSYTLPYPAISYASHAAGAFFHPYSNYNPLQAPINGYIPSVPLGHFPSAAALAASPVSAYYAGAVHPYNLPAYHASLGLNPALYPAGAATSVKGGYNVHGLTSTSYGYYHPGLNADLTTLGGKASSEGGESLMETNAAADAELDLADEDEAEAELDVDIAALESSSSSDSDADADADADAEAESQALLELSVEGEGEDSEHPTYVLPYPPVLPGHYTPLFNPYTNVNPLSTPFANYAAQPGAHPGVAAAGAAQAGALAAINSQVAGAAGAYPYYPFAARNPVIAANLAGNPIPFSGYAGWIHPQNLNSAAVGENDGEEFPQFVEMEAQEETGCVNCVFN